MRSLSIPTLALSMALGAGLAGGAAAQDADEYHGWGALLADGHEDDHHGAAPLLAAVMADEHGARLGVKVKETADGLLVTEVEAGTLAASAGVETDDLVLRIGDVRIQEVADVKRALAEFGPGDEVPVSVVREGEGIVKLEGRIPAPPKADAPDEDDDAFFRAGPGGAFLGVTMAEAEGGVMIEEVVTESSAWFAGLDEGDKLTAVDGAALASPSELAEAVSSRKVGAFVKLTYERDGESRTVRARLGSMRPRVQVFGRAPGAPGMRMLPRRSLAVPGNMRIDMSDHLDEHQLEKLHEHMDKLREMDLDLDFGGASGFKMKGPHGVFHLDMDDLQDMDVHQWVEKIDGGDASSIKIRIEDGVMTIEKDGEVETYSLDEVEDGDTFEWASPRSRNSKDA